MKMSTNAFFSPSVNSKQHVQHIHGEKKKKQAKKANEISTSYQ